MYLDEIAASPHGAVDMYMWKVISFFSFNLCFFPALFSNKLSADPGSCFRFRYKYL